MRRAKSLSMLWAAVAGVALLGLPAISRGQTVNQYTGNSPQNSGGYGHANDANNQVGSGGQNYSKGNTVPTATGNQVINGQVTNGFSWTGGGPNMDVSRFHATLPDTNLVNFTRDSTGVPVKGQTSIIPNQSMPFYGDDLGVPPPPGYGHTAPGQYGYVPVVPMTPAGIAQYHLGQAPDALSTTVAPQSSQLLLPTSYDASGNPIVLTASPLYGVQPVNLNNPVDQAFLQGLLDQGVNPNTVDPSTLKQLRDELNTTSMSNGAIPGAAIPNSPTVPQTGANGAAETNSVNGTPNGANGANGGNGGTNGANNQNTNPDAITQQVGTAPENPSNVAMTSALGSSQIQGTQVGSSIKQQPAAQMAAPEIQSAQYASLQARLKQFNAQRTNVTKISTPAAPAPTVPPPASTNPSQPVHGTGPSSETPSNPSADLNAILQHAAESSTKPEPLEIQSLATGVRARGLQDFLRRAEAQMAVGKFNSAVDTYDTAQQIAPNNPLIAVGRSNAELGAGLYSQAAHHLHDALSSDPSLLMAKFDLHKFIGDERLTEIVRQLKGISESDTSPQAMFLLAYIAYNTDHARLALGYLALADQRSGGKDPLYQSIRDHWTLPTTAPAEQTK